jgi:hypothetical protein
VKRRLMERGFSQKEGATSEANWTSMVCFSVRGSQLVHAERKTWMERPSNMMSRRDISPDVMLRDKKSLGAVYLQDEIIPDNRDSSSDSGYIQSNPL